VLCGKLEKSELKITHRKRTADTEGYIIEKTVTFQTGITEHKHDTEDKRNRMGNS
jgi:hypothetical protein